MILYFSKSFDFNLTDNLRHSEFRCSCSYRDCTHTLVSQDLIRNFQAFRNSLAVPLHITSGYRCQRHNGDLPNSSPKSMHKLGMAMDIAVPKQFEYALFAEKARPFFTRVLDHYEQQNFIHVNM